MKCFPLEGFLVSVAIRGDCCVRGFTDLFVAFFFFFLNVVDLGAREHHS